MELLAISLTQYIICEAYDNDKVFGILKNITHYLHQNCTNIIGLISPHLNSSSTSGSTLINILQIRKGYLMKHIDYVQSLYQHNNLLSCLLKNLCRIAMENFLNDNTGPNSTRARSRKLYNHKPIYALALDVLKQLDRANISASGIRENVKLALKKSMKILKRQGLIWSKEISYPAIPTPFLAPLNKPQETDCVTNEVKDYTLVLDLDETLVHYKDTRGKGKLLIRPGVETFLKETSKYYELVIFTAAMAEVIFNVKDSMPIGQ